MKKLTGSIIVTLAALFLTACANTVPGSEMAAIPETALETAETANAEEKSQYENLSDTVTDYTDEDNWMYLDKDPDKEVDLFYIYPSVCLEGNGEEIAPITDEMKTSANAVFTKQGMVLSGFTNVYAPYYRQRYLSVVCEDSDELDMMLRSGEPKTDVFAALDYYFENHNNGRPFILASHSQGSGMLKVVLEEYMALHPEYYENMIAAYALGFSFTEEDYEKYPHMKPATGELDTGVVISWNTEGPDATEPSFVILPNSVLINPLNWKTDETPATVEDNYGSLLKDNATQALMMTEGCADATIDLDRGALICTTQTDYIPAAYSMGDKSLHGHDWDYYAENIRRNAIKRTKEFLGHYPYSGTAADYSDEANWLRLDKEPDQEVDLIYIYPTVVQGYAGQGIAPVDDDVKTGAQSAYNQQAVILEEFTNVFIPLYRQVPLTTAFTCKSCEEYRELLRLDPTITDIYAALDYYFENLNNGRPFILASHSQGTAIASIVLSEYMGMHEEYLDRMVCAYTLGYAYTEEYFNQNPHLTFATGETDTGVIIGWNTEAAGEKTDSMLLSNVSKNLNINPLNWKTDDTYAGVEENLGSLTANPLTGTSYIGEGLADAQIDLERGSLICTTLDDKIMEIDAFGGRSLHGSDWSGYSMNIKENAKKRIAAYFEK